VFLKSEKKNLRQKNVFRTTPVEGLLKCSWTVQEQVQKKLEIFGYFPPIWTPFELFMDSSRTSYKKKNWLESPDMNQGSCFQLLYFVFIIVWAWHLHPSVFAFFYSDGNKQLAFTIDLPSCPPIPPFIRCNKHMYLSIIINTKNRPESMEKYGSTVLVVPLILFLLCLLWLPPLTNFNVIFRVSYFGRSFGQPTVFWNFTSWVSGTRPGTGPFLSYCFLIPPSDKPHSRYS